MQTYTSDFFDLSIGIPDSWELINWKNTKIKRTWRPLYQLRDDDLPNRIGASKFLFTANRHSRESAAIVDAGIELSVFRLSPGEDMYESMITNKAREGRRIHDEGLWIIREESFSYVDEAIKSPSTGTFRFAFRKFNGDLWLYAKIVGYSSEQFTEATEVFGSIIKKRKEPPPCSKPS